MVTASASSFGQLLIREALITPEILEVALARVQTSHERLGDALVAMGLLARNDVPRVLALQQGLPYLSRDELPDTLPLIKNLAPKYLREYGVCPLSVDGSVLTVATADPTNPIIVDDLRQATGLTVKLVVTSVEA